MIKYINKKKISPNFIFKIIKYLPPPLSYRISAHPNATFFQIVKQVNSQLFYLIFNQILNLGFLFFFIFGSLNTHACYADTFGRYNGASHNF